MLLRFVLLFFCLLILFGCSQQTSESEKPSATTQAVAEESEITPAKAPTVSEEPTETTSETETSSLQPTNQPPRINSVAFANPYVHRGVDIEAIPEVEDPDGDDVSVTYRWFLNGQELQEELGPILPGDRFVKGDRIALWLIPADEYGPGKTFYGSEFVIPNAPPQLTTDLQPVFQDNILDFVIPATDPDGDEITFSLSGAPEGMSIDAQSGKLYWAPKEAQLSQGPYHVQILLDDHDGGQTMVNFDIEERSIEK